MKKAARSKKYYLFSPLFYFSLGRRGKRRGKRRRRKEKKEKAR
jgi:hypothetical protein